LTPPVQSLVPWLLPLLVTGVIFKFLFQLQAGAVNQILLDLHLCTPRPDSRWRRAGPI
jgi:ABC-type sugar transport system permease subunit